MALQIALERQAGLQVVSLRGRLDSAGAPTLQTCLEELNTAGQHFLLFECSELRYVSSVGLGIFVTSAKLAQSKNGQISFAALTPHVRSVFEMVGLMTIFEVFPTVAEAVERKIAQNTNV